MFDFTMSMTRVAVLTAAVPWLATVFELAATSMRLVTAMSPKTSTMTATRASTSVKPASPAARSAHDSCRS